MEKIIKDILLVEDRENDVILIKSALENLNFANKIVVAEDGEEALDYLYRKGKFASIQSGYPIFILLDIKMPLLTGIEVLKIIRGDHSFNSIPVIMLSSSRNPHDLNECYDNGANAFVVKPIKIDEFLKAVKELGNYWAILGHLCMKNVKTIKYNH
jgi:CheY-like chemotaxis protein